MVQHRFCLDARADDHRPVYSGVLICGVVLIYRKAAENCRTPKRGRSHNRLSQALAFWSAVLLHRFLVVIGS
jgi:hypothetical protein